MSQNEKTYKGNCFCGAVEIIVSGDAEMRRSRPTATASPAAAGPPVR